MSKKRNKLSLVTKISRDCLLSDLKNFVKIEKVSKSLNKNTFREYNKIYEEEYENASLTRIIPAPQAFDKTFNSGLVTGAFSASHFLIQRRKRSHIQRQVEE